MEKKFSETKASKSISAQISMKDGYDRRQRAVSAL